MSSRGELGLYDLWLAASLEVVWRTTLRQVKGSDIGHITLPGSSAAFPLCQDGVPRQFLRA